MADYSELKAAIRAAIFDNTEQAITGESLQEILVQMVDELGESYVLPEGGIPASDMAQAVRDALAEAVRAYQLPVGGIPEADLAQAVRAALAAALSAYQKPQGGIPSSDLASPIRESLGKAESAVQPRDIDPILDVIPAQASESNKLADKNFVNSSIATNTAYYISDNGEPFSSLADLQAYAGPLTNNDYAFVVGTDAAGNTTYTRYKYNASTQTWAEEYVLNNSSFTAAQWAAINSGIDGTTLQQMLEDIVAAYVKPASGIPETDLAQGVRDSLALADTAYQKPPTGIPASDMAPGVIPSVPAISTDIAADATSDTKTASPKAVKTYVDNHTPSVPVEDVTVGGISVVANKVAVIPSIPTVEALTTAEIDSIWNTAMA